MTVDFDFGSAQMLAGLEDNILTMLCFDDKQSSQLALELPAELFTTEANRRIVTAIYGFLEAYHVPPKEHIRDLLEKELGRQNELGRALARTINEMANIFPAMNAQYVLDSYARWAELRRLGIAYSHGLDAVSEGNLDKARKAREEIPFQASKGEPGIWLHDPASSLKYLDADRQQFFSSGVKLLDEKHVRPSRKSMFLLIAPSGKGKSWAMVQVGKHGLLYGHSVLHLTLEMSQDEVAQRYHMACFGMTDDEAKKVKIRKFVPGDPDSGNTFSIEEKYIDREGLRSFDRAELEKKVRSYATRPFVHIKEFPSGTLTLAALNGYLDMLERRDRFVPDLLIVDYPDLMQVDNSNRRIALGGVFVGLRGIAGTRNMAVVCCTQGNRISAESKEVRATMVGEDWSKIQTADVVVTVSQTAAEENLNLARLLVEKNRRKRGRFVVLISQDYEGGQFCVDSSYMNNLVAGEVERLAERSADT